MMNALRVNGSMIAMSTPGSRAVAGAVKTSAGQRAYEWIRDAILSGEFAEGEFIDEVALAARVGTSRTPVREALQRLQVERYVDLLPRRGAQVRVVTAVEMREIYQARFVLESDALRTICQRQAGAPESARQLIEEMEQAGRERNWNRFAQLDQVFHSEIVRHQRNAVIAEMYDALQPRQVRLGTRTLAEAPARLSVIEREHRELIAALDRHDAMTSVDVLRQHLREIPELVDAFEGHAQVRSSD
ncbi:GntR family transcriptional regulator [Mycolicibacterium smegmatis]|uniref:GntR family transcriptional regulator n=1 Tax=Mycolicibacterium smegmatis TaxID=1772 RepID=UPI0020A507E6|nr:GntR family transcriptional regulator [Mycolicibacterium smegmatis]MCP2622115.1 GntR family transcriptional regulator [Mycolicibacterium smegmatis]